MAKLQEIDEYVPEIDALSRGDAVEGGLSGVANQPLKQLASRTKWLKRKVEESLPSASFNPAAFATAAQGTKADQALPASSFNPAAFATAAQGTKADQALPASSFNPAAFATAAQGTKADQALPASSFNPADFATAAQGTKADQALPASSSGNFASAAQGMLATNGCLAQSGASTFHDNKLIKTKMLTTTAIGIGEGIWEAKVAHGLGDVIDLQRIVSLEVQVKHATHCEVGFSHYSTANTLSLRYDNTFVQYLKADSELSGKTVMFTLRYVDP